EIKNQLLPIGLIDLEMLEQIYKAREFTEILIALKKTQYYHDLHSFMIEKRKLNKEFDKQFITNFELLLDFCNYFEFIVYDKYIIDIPYKNKDSEKIIKIFKDYVDGLNYLKLVEGLKENKDFDKIKLFQCGNINIEKAKRIYVRKQNILILLNHEMKKLLKNEYDTTKLESLINKYFYMKLSKIFKKETLTINAIASYMFMKLHEYSSLLAIIKAKRYGLSKEEIYIL
ncbi:MAG: V-type ATPase subunit, partial [Candidatus Anstonellales archaeon]